MAMSSANSTSQLFGQYVAKSLISILEVGEYVYSTHYAGGWIGVYTQDNGRIRNEKYFRVSYVDCCGEKMTENYVTLPKWGFIWIHRDDVENEKQRRRDKLHQTVQRIFRASRGFKV